MSGVVLESRGFLGPSLMKIIIKCQEDLKRENREHTSHPEGFTTHPKLT